jgi:hypothetical protein
VRWKWPPAPDRIYPGGGGPTRRHPRSFFFWWGILVGIVDIDSLIAKAKANLDTVEPVTQEILVGGQLVGARFWPLTGPAWRDLCATNPPRMGSASDQQFGYNLDAVVRAYPRVYLVEGDEITDLTVVDDAGKRVSRWPEIVDTLSGPDLKNLGYAVWGLNDYDPAQKLVAAGKASKGGLRKKRNSPES